MSWTFFFGFDEEQQKPWRLQPKTKKREFGEIVVDPDGTKDGPSLAKFRDGSTQPLPQVTNAEASAILSTQVHRRGNFWDGVHAPTGAKLRVARRARMFSMLAECAVVLRWYSCFSACTHDFIPVPSRRKQKVCGVDMCTRGGLTETLWCRSS